MAPRETIGTQLVTTGGKTVWLRFVLEPAIGWKVIAGKKDRHPIGWVRKANRWWTWSTDGQSWSPSMTLDRTTAAARLVAEVNQASQRVGA